MLTSLPREPGAGHAWSLTASAHPGGPPAGEAWAVPPGRGLPHAHVRPDRPLLAQSSRAEVGAAAQYGSRVGWPLRGVGAAPRGREGKQAPLLPALEEHESPTPTRPPARSVGTSPLPSCSNGSGSRGCADALPPLTLTRHQPPPPNCQLTGPAARPAARASCSAARPCGRTAHVRARAATRSGREGRRGAAGRGAAKFVWGLGGAGRSLQALSSAPEWAPLGPLSPGPISPEAANPNNR